MGCKIICDITKKEFNKKVGYFLNEGKGTVHCLNETRKIYNKLIDKLNPQDPITFFMVDEKGNKCMS